LQAGGRRFESDRLHRKSPGRQGYTSQEVASLALAGSQSVATARLLRTDDAHPSSPKVGTSWDMRRLSTSDPEAVIAHLRAQLDQVQDDIASISRLLDDIAVLTAPPPATLLTVEEVAQLLRVSRTRVFELLAAHELDGVMLGRRRLVPRKSVEALLSGRPYVLAPSVRPVVEVPKLWALAPRAHWLNSSRKLNTRSLDRTFSSSRRAPPMKASNLCSFMVRTRVTACSRLRLAFGPDSSGRLPVPRDQS